jgi:hypothetical protein
VIDKENHTAPPPLEAGKFYVRRDPSGSWSEYKTERRTHGIVLLFYGDYVGWVPTLERSPEEYVATRLEEVKSLDFKDCYKILTEEDIGKRDPRDIPRGWQYQYVLPNETISDMIIMVSEVPALDAYHQIPKEHQERLVYFTTKG